LGRAWGLDLRQVCENGKWGKDAIVGNGIDGLHYVNTNDVYLNTQTRR